MFNTVVGLGTQSLAVPLSPPVMMMTCIEYYFINSSCPGQEPQLPQPAELLSSAQPLACPQVSSAGTRIGRGRHGTGSQCPAPRERTLSQGLYQAAHLPHFGVCCDIP